MSPKNYVINRSWAEVNLDAIAQNIQAIRKMTWKSTEIMAVVKADAYGHGVAHVANTLLENGADRLAVSLLDEAIELRQMGIRAPIMILSYSDPRRAHEIVKYRLTQTVYSWDLIHALDEAANFQTAHDLLTAERQQNMPDQLPSVHTHIESRIDIVRID